MQNTIQVTAAQLLIALVGAAAIGALVSSLLTLWGQFLERRARKRELLLTKAIALTESKIDSSLRIAEHTGVKNIKVVDPIIHTEAYYKWLKPIFDEGSLPNDKNIERE